MILLPADIILTHSETGWLGKAIRFVEQRPGDPAWANHVGIVTDSGTIVPKAGIPIAVMVESLWHVRQGTVWDGYGPAKGPQRAEVLIYRPYTLPSATRTQIAAVAEQYVGRHYAWWRLLMHAADWELSKRAGHQVYVFRRLNFARDTECSGLVQRAYATSGYTFEVPRGVIPNPDDIHDFCYGNPDKYRLIFGPGRIGPESVAAPQVA